jgi:hypothetical protein
LSSGESLEEGVYKSTQWAQLVQLATRETMFPFDWSRLAHFQGSKLCKYYPNLHYSLADWMLLSSNLHIRCSFDRRPATEALRRHPCKTVYRSWCLFSSSVEHERLSRFATIHIKCSIGTSRLEKNQYFIYLII